MSAYTDRLRDKLTAMTFTQAQRFMVELVRQAARNAIWRRAQAYKIVDFDVAALVEQKHRDFRDSVLSQAATAATSVSEATTKPELVPIFNLIEPWLE